MDGATDNKGLEHWDRMALLLIAQPRDGWASEFEEITRREIERLKPVPVTEAGDE